MAPALPVPPVPMAPAPPVPTKERGVPHGCCIHTWHRLQESTNSWARSAFRTETKGTKTVSGHEMLPPLKALHLASMWPVVGEVVTP
eukprot:scaffold203862_cov17-Tisochrysis_lutea.AAC.1